MKRKKSKSAKAARLKTKSSSKPSTGLYADFDEANDAILQVLEALEEDPDIALVCDRCGCEFKYDGDFIEEPCTECKGGALQITRGDNGVIKLPESLKSAAKSFSDNSSGSWHYGGGSQGFTSLPKCKHEGKEVVFEHNGKQLFAVSSNGMNEWSGRWELIIDLAGIVTIPSNSSFLTAAVPKQFQGLLNHVLKPAPLPSEVLRLYWADMGIPPVTLQFWQELWLRLPAKTAICCHGGHGRTGTCLASLMITAGYSYDLAVEAVRTVHCANAIESFAQEKYLHNLYVERLRDDSLRASDDTERGVINEEIATALANPPVQETKVTGSKWSAGAENATAGEPKDSTFVPAHSMALPSDSKEMVTALKSGHNLRQRGQSVWVEECAEKGCIKSDCKIAAHQRWILWQNSMTQVDSMGQTLIDEFVE